LRLGAGGFAIRGPAVPARAILLTLVLGPAALAQPTRERGRFSLQGDAATVMAMDAKVQYALIAFNGGTVCVFPTDQRTVSLYTYPIHKKAVNAAAFTPDSKSFVTASADGTVKVWDILAARKHHKEMEEKGSDAKPPVPKPLLSITAHSGNPVTALAVSPDGKLYATGGSDGNVKLWHSDTGKVALTKLGAHPGGVRAVQFSPDGKVLATAGADRTVKLWDPGTTDAKPEPFYTLIGHGGPVNAVAFRPDGKQLAAATGVAKKSGTIHVWDATTGKPAFKLEGHEDVVTCVLFHPKTAHLASGGADKTIRVWDLKEKETQYTDEHSEALRNFVISPDGSRFGSCSGMAVRWWSGFGK
jgi:WD40 repeat protein